MKVKDAIALLQQQDPEAELVMEASGYEAESERGIEGSHIISTIYSDTIFKFLDQRYASTDFANLNQALPGHLKLDEPINAVVVSF